MQISYSRLWDGYQTDAEAKQARDKHYRELVKRGRLAKRFTLRDQIRQYAGLGQPDGRSCTVYMIDIHDSH